MPRSRRTTIKLPEPRHEDQREREYHDRDERVSEECVWHDGVDITDTHPPSEWPWPMSMYYEAGWRPWRSLDDPGNRYLPRDT